MRLHNFHASSASFRARVALKLKGIEFEYVPVRLRRGDGEQNGEDYRKLNPQAKVPLLIDGEVSIAQTVAIIEYLEEVKPEPRLLPADAVGRARVRSLSLFVACEVQPLSNLRVEKHLARVVGLDEPQLVAWRRHWISVGFDALEVMLAAPETGRFCHGDAPTMADCFLVPQVFNSQRPTVALELGRWPIIERIYRTCLELEAFASALPENQPDADRP